MELRLIYLIATIILFTSCNKVKIKKNEKIVSQKIRQTTIRFIKKPKDTIQFKGGGGYKFSPVVNIIYNNGLEKEILVKKINQIYKINLKNETLFLRHVYRGNDIYFEINKGDTTTYFEKDGFPIYRGKNEKLNLSNQYIFIKKEYLKLKYPTSWNFYFFNNFIRNNPNKRSISKVKETYVLNFENNNKKELKLLDSLYYLKKIDKKRYELQFEKNKFDKINLYYQLKLKKSFIRFDTVEKYTRKDKLLKFKFYKTFLHNYVIHKYKIGIIKTSHSRTFNSKSLFDSIVNSDNFSKKIINYLLYKNLKQIITNYPQQDAEVYLNKFKEKVNDSILINSLKNTYLLDYNKLKNDTENINLINLKKEQQTLNKIINNNKGKLIYIDFWASWCAPCRAAMPASRKLHKDYKNKELVFVYLSIDKNFDKWKKASEEENLVLNKNNYLSVNYPNADFYKKLNLKTIPRYILYDKKGKLIHQNAPGPNGKEIRRLLDKYLKK